MLRPKSRRQPLRQSSRQGTPWRRALSFSRRSLARGPRVLESALISCSAGTAPGVNRRACLGTFSQEYERQSPLGLSSIQVIRPPKAETAEERMVKKTFSVLGRIVGILATSGLLLLGGPPSEAQEGPRLQDQVPLKDQLSGRALRGYKQHVQLVGHNNIRNRLQNGNLGWVDDCAYVSAYYGGAHPTAGLAILNVADPRTPQLVRILPGTPGTRESQVEGNQYSRIVVVMPFTRATPPGFPFSAPAREVELLQIYDDPGDVKTRFRRGKYNFGKENGNPCGVARGKGMTT